MQSAQFATILLLTTTCTTSAIAGQPASLVEDGDFQRQDLNLGRHDKLGSWVIRNHGARQATIEIVADRDSTNGRWLQYDNTGEGSHNIHVDQLVPVTPDTIYEVRARVRGDGNLEPLIAIQTKDWTNLVTVSCGKSTDWSEIHLLFHSFDNETVRFEWFPGAVGELYSGVAGTSWLDDVTILPIDNPSPSLLAAFSLKRSLRGEEVDLQKVSTGTIGDPLPLRRITATEGVLRYEDGTEVALWGVNLQTPLSWEYNGRLKPLGVPHTVEALKEITAQNLDQMPLLGVSAIRAHLLPADFTGPEGEIRDTIYLDVLDDLLTQCSRRGIYVYLTLMNEMNTTYQRDSFVGGHEREEWIFDPALAAKSERYVREFLDRTNRYTGVRYADDPTIAVVEIMNEPHYPTRLELQNEPHLKACLDAFSQWRSSQPGNLPAEAIYPAYRYEIVRRYLNRMCATVRGTGCPAPVVWNLNWPRMVNGREDVFQAAADSKIDGVSFCCYPGQSDVKSPFWANPADLSGNNYLPYLQKCYSDYSYLRWMLGKRFAKKAKMAYEFETMYNHTAHLYPAMARMFRALGAQIAPMWQYTLSPVAEYRAGSHYLNAYCTPQKAVSFRIASQVFATTPRYAPFDTSAKTEMLGPDWAISFDNDLAIWSSDNLFFNSGNVDWSPLDVPNAPAVIAGCGNSPLVSYEGTGMYQLEFADNRAVLRILPDVRYTYPPWQRRGSKPSERVCELNPQAEHVFELRVEGWAKGVEVMRFEKGENVPVVTRDAGTRFVARPGRYQLARPEQRIPKRR